MTVKELIELLKNLDQDKEIHNPDDTGVYYSHPITRVYADGEIYILY